MNPNIAETEEEHSPDKNESDEPTSIAPTPLRRRERADVHFLFRDDH